MHPVIRIKQKGIVWCVSMVGTPFEKAQRTRNSAVRCWLPTLLFTAICLCFCRVRRSYADSIVKALAGYVLSAYTFLPALSLAYAYTYAQDNPTRKVSFFIITFDAKYLPLALLFMTLIIDDGEQALAQATGLIAAHLYDFLTRIWPTFGGGNNYIKTPAIVKQWFGATGGSQQARPYGMAQQGRTTTAEPAPSGRSTGSQWGPGRRLGDQ